jgi:hypothetical protein
MLDIQKPWQKKVATPQISETLQWCSLNQTVWRMAQKTTWRDQATSRISPSDRITRPRAARRTRAMNAGHGRGITGHHGAHFLRFGSRWVEGGQKLGWGYLTPTWDMLKYVEWLQVPKKRNAPQIVIKSLRGNSWLAPQVGVGALELFHSSTYMTTYIAIYITTYITTYITFQLTLRYNLHYITLHCIAFQSITFHYVTFHYITLQLTLHYIATFIALHCNFHCITSRYITLHFNFPYLALHYISLHYSTLYYIHVYGYPLVN